MAKDAVIFQENRTVVPPNIGTLKSRNNPTPSLSDPTQKRCHRMHIVENSVKSAKRKPFWNEKFIIAS